MMDSVEKIAEVVLYEGYLLYPYRRSAVKNQQRWTFGGVYPRRYSEGGHDDDPWVMQTQCLVVGHEDTALDVTVRFLHVVDRGVAAPDRTGALRPVEELRVGEQVYRPWEEAVEREIGGGGPGDRSPRLAQNQGTSTGTARAYCHTPLRWPATVGRLAADGSLSLPSGDGQGVLHTPLQCTPSAKSLGELVGRGRRVAIDIPAGSAQEPLVDPAGEEVGALVREWRPLQGAVEITAERLGQDPDDAAHDRSVYRLTVRIVNTTPWTPPCEGAMRSRDAALRQTFVSTHTILHVQGGAFVSLLETPSEYEEAARQCQNIKTWPVLVGEHGERHTMLSSPIILYDYPQIAPESPGNLFDTTEIDELLTLSVLALTDEEKQEMRESDVHAREILERTEALAPEQLMKLHGAIRGLQPLRREDG